jgi:integrase
LGAISAGADPAEDRRSARLAEKERRGAPAVSDLLDRYLKDYAERHKRQSSVQSDRCLIDKHIRPDLGTRKVAQITHAEVEHLHRAISSTAPIAANRAVAVLSKAMSLAIRWGWRADNPCKGVERNPEERRDRYLMAAELGRLCEALNRRQGRIEASCIALMMLTGCRRGEALTARWRDFEPTNGVWIKPSAHTKQKKLHRVPLSAAAQTVLTNLAGQLAPAEPPPEAFVFGGPKMIHRLRATCTIYDMPMPVCSLPVA